ncbi:alpha/beta hydrolase-fold protein [Lactiplantibacillus paraplantarum]|uniref:alpha/beta hydrolase n=1 Tax=Lactiplantibacillus paraplantarum TaxID=60520 RepID=UPI0021A3525E|nr:alpha/beta hydrolase-fold protein [Lactiplantibacillus paraplantarum]
MFNHQSTSQEPKRTKQTNSAASRVTQIKYQTRYWNKTYEKSATVYLPAKYRTSHKYNVLYLMHGSTEGNRDFFDDGNFQKMLDQLSQNDVLRDTIVVFPTYYPDRSFVTNDYYSDYPLNQRFADNELIHDLVPAVEGRYSTFANGTSIAALKASRSHRAFGGFSMGAITTWAVFEHDLAYFKDFIPMAGDSWTVESDGGGVASARTAQVLASVTKPELPFHIFAAVGQNDGTQSSMQPQLEAMWRLSAFNRQNLKWYVQPGGTHSPQSISKQFQHYAPQLFK